jgi:pimeloyl-ACP methyl ester carboxylesterase
MPILAIDQDGSNFTAASFAAAAPGRLMARTIPGTGHYIAMEAPEALAATILQFTGPTG